MPSRPKHPHALTHAVQVLDNVKALQCALQAYRLQLAPTVVQHLQEVSAACPPGAAGSLPPPHSAPAGGDSSERLVVPDAVRAKEAVYAAMGTGAYELHDYVDFTPWFRTTLLQVRVVCLLSVDCCSTLLQERGGALVLSPDDAMAGGLRCGRDVSCSCSRLEGLAGGMCHAACCMLWCWTMLSAVRDQCQGCQPGLAGLLQGHSLGWLVSWGASGNAAATPVSEAVCFLSTCGSAHAQGPGGLISGRLQLTRCGTLPRRDRQLR